MKFLPTNFLYFFSIEGGAKFLVIISVLFSALGLLGSAFNLFANFTILNAVVAAFNLAMLSLYVWAARGIKRRDAKVALLFSYIYAGMGVLSVVFHTVAIIFSIGKPLSDLDGSPSGGDHNDGHNGHRFHYSVSTLTWPLAITYILLEVLIYWHFCGTIIAFARQLVIENNMRAVKDPHSSFSDKMQYMALSVNEPFWTGEYSDELTEESNVPVEQRV